MELIDHLLLISRWERVRILPLYKILLFRMISDTTNTFLYHYNFSYDEPIAQSLLWTAHYALYSIGIGWNYLYSVCSRLPR